MNSVTQMQLCNKKKEYRTYGYASLSSAAALGEINVVKINTCPIHPSSHHLAETVVVQVPIDGINMRSPDWIGIFNRRAINIARQFLTIPRTYTQR